MKNILILILMFVSALVSASDSIITYEDFVHLDFNNQKKVIHLVHNFLNEYERMERQEQLRHSKSRKYQTYKRILNLFISSAHAMEKEKFMPQTQDSCIYAGWTSKMTNGFCNHPIGTGMNSDYSKNHEGAQYIMVSINGKELKVDEANKSGASCKNIKIKDNWNKNVECNPKLFGSLNGKTFCVNGGNKARNASLLCSKAVESYNTKEKKDKYNEIMKSIVHSSEEDKGSQNDIGGFTEMMQSMYNTCLCGGAATIEDDKFYTGKLNRQYTENMYYSRTCYGILSQTRRIKENLSQMGGSCLLKQSVASGSDTWKEFLDNVHSVESVINRELDDKKNHFSNKINNIQGNVKDWTDRKNYLSLYCPMNKKSVPTLKLAYDNKTNMLTVSYNKLTTAQISKIVVNNIKPAIVVESSKKSPVTTSQEKHIHKKKTPSNVEITAALVDSTLGKKNPLPKSNSLSYLVTVGTNKTTFQANIPNSKIKSNVVSIAPHDNKPEDNSLKMKLGKLELKNQKIIQSLDLKLKLKGKDQTKLLTGANTNFGESKEIRVESPTADKVQFYAIVSDKAQKIEAAYGKIKSEELEIPAVNLTCTMNKQFDEGKGIITIKLDLKIKNLSAPIPSDNITVTGLDGFKADKSKLLYTKESKTESKVSSVNAKISLGSGFKAMCELKTETPTTTELASCSIDLNKSLNEAGTFDIIPTIKAKKKGGTEEKEMTAQEAEKQGMSLTWFDSKKVNRKTASSDTTVSLDENYAEDEKKEKTSKLPKDIKKGSNSVGPGPSITGIVPQGIDRTISVHIKGKGCEDTASITIAKLKGPAGNAQPTQQQLDTSQFGQGQGFYIRGTR
jgi:hypothetical protein